MMLWEVPRATSTGPPVATSTRCGISPVVGSSRSRTRPSHRDTVAPNRAGSNASCSRNDATATVESTGQACPG